MTYPVRKSDKLAPEAASDHPGVIYENLPEAKYTPGHAWAAYCSTGIAATIHLDDKHQWVVALTKPSAHQLKTAYRKAFGAYNLALAALQEQLTKAGAPKGSSLLWH